MSRDKFDAAVARWEHNGEDTFASRDPQDHVDSKAVADIIAIGPDALPLIKEHLVAKPNSLILVSAWLPVVRELMPDNLELLEQIRGNMADIRAHLIAVL